MNGIDAPAGIYIGAVNPEEVAVSVLAELVKRRRLGTDNHVTTKSENGVAGEDAGECCSSRKAAVNEFD